MESIANYDAWKLASPEEYVDQNEIDILERGLKPCPFCLGKAFFEETADDWLVACDCGARIPGDDAQEAAAKWMTRPREKRIGMCPPREAPRTPWPGA